jgi:hypothetical protein
VRLNEFTSVQEEGKAGGGFTVVSSRAPLHSASVARLWRACTREGGR